MALAFFTTPTLASLATFGFGGTTTTTEDASNTSESKPSEPTSAKNDTLSPAKSEERPVSASVGAIIKCSDCGGDVPLLELGEHVCSPKPLSKVPTPSPPAPAASEPAPAPAPAPTPSASEPAPPPPPAPPSSPQQKKHESKHISQSSITKPISAPKVETPPSPPKPSPTPESSPPPATQPSLVQSFFSFMKPAAEPAPSPPPTLPPTPEKSPPRPISRTSQRTPRAHRLSSSGSSILNSESSGPSNPVGRSRIPFLEKYAQLVPMNKDPLPITTTTIPTTNTKPISIKKWEEPKRSPIDTNSQSGSSSRPSNVSIESAQTSKSKSKKIITPPTSPEISPSEKIGFASLQRSQLRKDRPLPSSTSMPFEDRTRQRAGSEARRDPKPPPLRKLPSSQSASAGLDRLLASEAFIDSDEEKDNLPSKSSAEAFETPKTSAKSSRKPSRKASDGLEDLMGDLMNEMTRKAELSTYQLKEKKKSTPPRNLPSPAIKSPHKRSATESDAMFDTHDPDMTPRVHLRNNSANNIPNVPDSPGIRPSDSISQLGFDHPPSPPPARALFSHKHTGDDRCQHCGKQTDSRTAKIRSSSIDPNGAPKALFCQTCYAELYLPKCRKCERPIERRAVTDRVGKVLGKYHPECFNCFKCSAKFPDGEFYVWERKPVCARHYHRFAGTICANESCRGGIEGPCISLSLEASETGRSTSDGGSSFSRSSSSAHRKRLYHPEHFTCTSKGCKSSLEEFHFVIGFQPWCEKHARMKYSESLASQQQTNEALAENSNSPWARKPRTPSRDQLPSRPMERRRTIIQNVRKR